MNSQDLLIQTVLQAKCTATNMADDLINKNKSGDNMDCCMKELSLLVHWIDILERYNCQKYINTAEDRFQCLTDAEAMELIGKVKIFIA